MSKVERGSAAGQLSCGGRGGHMCASVQWQLKLCASVQPGANMCQCLVPVYNCVQAARVSKHVVWILQVYIGRASGGEAEEFLCQRKGLHWRKPQTVVQ